MQFTEMTIAGAWTVELEPRADDRGFFARAFCADEFAAHGADPAVAQANLSWNVGRGTLRGLHFQYPPDAETKFVRCIRGAVFDVVVDLRPGSPTFGRWAGAELTAGNRRALIAPAGTAHGYLTLADDTEVLYLASSRYSPGAESGLRWDDPDLAIDWPGPVLTCSDKDASWPALAGRVEEIRSRMAGPEGWSR